MKDLEDEDDPELDTIAELRRLGIRHPGKDDGFIRIPRPENHQVTSIFADGSPNDSGTSYQMGSFQ